MEVEVKRKDGTGSGETVRLDPSVFGIEPNDHAIYMLVRSTMANKRQGTHKVKARNEVRGGGRKPYRQKKTGRARAGTTRSPLWVGGGSIFGPKPHTYSVKLTEKMRKLARKSALSYKAKEQAIIVVEDFSLEAPKSREISGMLKLLELSRKKTLFLTPKTDETMYKSGRNIRGLNVQSADNASTYDILANQVILIQKSAVDVLQKPLLK